MKRFFIILAFMILAGFNPDKRIDLEVYDADIKGVYSMLSEMQGLNFVCGKGVKGKVTLKMKNATWSEVVDTISHLNNLKWEVKGGNLFVYGVRKEKELRIIPLSYSSCKDLIDRVSKFISKDGSIDIDERTNSIIVMDYKENVKKVEELLKKLDIPTKQILIQARIVSVDYSHVRDIGIQWGGYYYRSSDGTKIGVSGAATADKVSSGGSVGNIGTEVSEENMAINLPPEASTSGIFFALGKVSKSELYRINARIMALVERRKAEILSEPRIVTIDNREARIGQGTEIPYQTVSESGTKTEFRKAELSLYVKPKVTADGNIFLTLTVTKDSMGVMTSAGPTINTQRVETNLLLKDGETAVIGGIVEEDKTFVREEVPILSKLPIIGKALFSRRQKSKGKKEMLVFITPKVLGKVEAKR